MDEIFGHMVGLPEFFVGASGGGGGGGGEPSGDWWDGGVAADAYGGDFKTEMDASFLVTEYSWFDGSSEDTWRSLQHASYVVTESGGSYATREEGATEVAISGTSTFAETGGWVTGGDSGDELFGIYLLDIDENNNSQPVMVHPCTGSGKSITASYYPTGAFGVTVNSTSYGFMSSINIAAIEGVNLNALCVAFYLNQTEYRVWVNGEIVLDTTHSLSFDLSDESFSMSCSTSANSFAGFGVAYSEPSDVPQMMMDVAAYWQDGTPYDPYNFAPLNDSNNALAWCDPRYFYDVDNADWYALNHPTAKWEQSTGTLEPTFNNTTNRLDFAEDSMDLDSTGVAAFGAADFSSGVYLALVGQFDEPANIDYVLTISAGAYNPVIALGIDDPPANTALALFRFTGDGSDGYAYGARVDDLAFYGAGQAPSAKMYMDVNGTRTESAAAHTGTVDFAATKGEIGQPSGPLAQGEIGAIIIQTALPTQATVTAWRTAMADNDFVGAAGETL